MTDKAGLISRLSHLLALLQGLGPGQVFNDALFNVTPKLLQLD